MPRNTGTGLTRSAARSVPSISDSTAEIAKSWSVCPNSSRNRGRWLVRTLIGFLVVRFQRNGRWTHVGSTGHVRRPSVPVDLRLLRGRTRLAQGAVVDLLPRAVVERR